MFLISLIYSASVESGEAIAISEEARLVVLERELRRQSHLYESGAQPDLLDVEYDRIEEQWRSMLGVAQTGESLPRRERGTADAIEGTHFSPMLSLRKAESPEAVESVFKRMKTRYGWDEPVGLVVEAKLDGVAISLVYEGGVFVKALSRGDGERGVDWTQKVLAIGGIPLKLRPLKGDADIPGKIEIRGEVTIGREAFDAFIASCGMDEAIKPTTARSYAASTLQMEDLKIIGERQLGITVFAMGEWMEDRRRWTREAFRDQLVEWGFTVPDALVLAGIDGLSGAIRSFWERVKDGDQPLDGLVIKLNNFSHWEAAGWTQEWPVGAIAWKPRGPVGVTRVAEVTWEPTRHGALVPVAILEPIEIAGREVRRVYLHNRSIQASLGIQTGTPLEIELAGDVIPVVGRVLRDDANETEAGAPEVCPECGGGLEWVEPHLRCMGTACSGIQLARLRWFVEKMRIRGLGDVTLKKVFETGLVDGPWALYELPKRIEVLQALTGPELAVQISRSVEASKGAPTARWIEAIGIEGVGAAKARELERMFGSLADVEASCAAGAASGKGVPEENSPLRKLLEDHFERPDRLAEWGRLARIQAAAFNEEGFPMR